MFKLNRNLRKIHNYLLGFRLANAKFARGPKIISYLALKLYSMASHRFSSKLKKLYALKLLVP